MPRPLFSYPIMLSVITVAKSLHVSKLVLVPFADIEGLSGKNTHFPHLLAQELHYLLSVCEMCVVGNLNWRSKWHKKNTWVQCMVIIRALYKHKMQKIVRVVLLILKGWKESLDFKDFSTLNPRSGSVISNEHNAISPPNVINIKTLLFEHINIS